jgi:WD40 repeat protein
MLRVTSQLQTSREALGPVFLKRRAIRWSRLSIFDVRLLLVSGVVLFAIANLSAPDPVPAVAPSRVARGELGVQIMSFAISAGSAQIATSDTVGRVTLRTPDRGWHIERPLDFPGYARTVALSPDGKWLAAVGFQSEISLWDLNSPSSDPTTTRPIPIKRPNRMVFAPDSQSLAVASDSGGTILLVDLAEWRERTVFHYPSPAICIALSPDGRWLATGGKNDCSILLWDLHSGSRRVLLQDGPGPVVALAFSPDSARLASASRAEPNARLWDLGTRQMCRVFAGHARSLNSLSFSPDGSLLATASNDGLVGLWVVATGRRWASLDGHATCLRSVAFSPDGRTVVLATNNDDDLRLWDLAELP